jgi:hypothetical protein
VVCILGQYKVEKVSFIMDIRYVPRSFFCVYKDVYMQDLNSWKSSVRFLLSFMVYAMKLFHIDCNKKGGFEFLLCKKIISLHADVLLDMI